MAGRQLESTKQAAQEYLDRQIFNFGSRFYSERELKEIVAAEHKISVSTLNRAIKRRQKGTP